MSNQQHHVNQQGFVLWMTGLSGAGKTTIALDFDGAIANARRQGRTAGRRRGARKPDPRSGFTAEDRAQNIERVTFVAKLLSRNGVGCVCSFISPYQSVRDERARQYDQLPGSVH